MPKKSKTKNNKKLNRLPNPSKDISLSADGYSLRYVDDSRRKALRKSSKKHGTLNVLKRVNLIRNISKDGSKNKKTLSKDVEYLKKLYAKQKNKTKSK